MFVECIVFVKNRFKKCSVQFRRQENKACIKVPK